MWEIISLLGGLKTALATVAGLIGSVWLWLLNRNRKNWKDEAVAWRQVAAQKKKDEGIDAETNTEKSKVDAIGDDPDALRDAFQHVRDGAETHNRQS